MSVETEHYLNEAAQVKNIGGKHGRLVTKAKRYLRHNERERRETEARRIREMLTPTNMQLSKIDSLSAQQARQHLNALEVDLEENSPPTDLRGETRDGLYKRFQQLKDEITPVLLPREIMRRNPPGSVGKFLKGEGSAAVKAKILEARNLALLLDPRSDDPDLCNIETWRPEKALPKEAATFHADAQIPGNFAMTPLAKANWPEGLNEYAENSPLMVAERKELEELRAMKERYESQHKEFQRRYGMSERTSNVKRKARSANKTPEERAASTAKRSAAMKARWEARKVQTTSEITPNDEIA